MHEAMPDSNRVRGKAARKGNRETGVFFSLLPSFLTSCLKAGHWKLKGKQFTRIQEGPRAQLLSYRSEPVYVLNQFYGF